MINSFFQPYPDQCVTGDFSAFPVGSPPVDQGEFHIFDRRKLRQQIEVLKDEADFFIADLCKLIVGQFADFLAVQEIIALVRDIQTSEHVHQC
ncbi:hypothetical protein D3C73_1303320 [compost metagenome]